MTAEKTPNPDWLDDLFPGAAARRTEMFEKGVVFAQRYLVFAGPTADPRAKELLEHWTKYVRGNRINPSASHAELAAHNALREWVEGIHQQIDLAQQNASVTSKRNLP